MNLKNTVALITGGASGLGEATLRNIVSNGGKALIIDLNDERGNAIVNELGAEKVLYVKTDVTSEAEVQNAIKQATEKFGKLNVAVNCAGIAPAMKTASAKGPHSLETFAKVININLIGTFNVIRLFSDYAINNIQPDENGERGVIINTASVAGIEGQIGQAAYSASKGGVIGMTLPIARDLADKGIRVMTIAPGLFYTPMASQGGAAPKEALDMMLSSALVNPKRMGNASEYAQLAQQIIENQMLNGEVIRLDGAVRLAPKFG